MLYRVSVLRFGILIVFSIAILTVSKSSASELTGSRGIYLVLGGGTDIQISGFDDGAYPALQAGVGYRCNWISFDLDFIWNTTDWHREDIPFHDEFNMPLVGGWTYPGNIVGGILYSRFFPFQNIPRFHPYILAGIGSQAVMISDTTPSHVITSRKESGTMWGLTVRGGIGVEVNIVWDISIDLAATLSYLYLLEEFEPSAPYQVYSPDGVVSINIVVAVKYSF